MTTPGPRTRLLLAAVLGAVAIAGSPRGLLALFRDPAPIAANVFSADTLNPPTAPAAIGGQGVAISWTATADTYADGHRVFRATSSGGAYTQIAQVTPRTTTSYVDAPGAGTFYYVVRAFRVNWASANSSEVSAIVTQLLYLHNNPTPPVAGTASQLNLPLNTTAPTAGTLYNYDTNRDGSAGLLVARGASGASESDATRFQAWRTAAGSRVVSPAPVLTFWSGIRNFGLNRRGVVTVYLRHWNGSAYTEICSGTLDLADWQAGSGTWVQRSISLSGCSYVVPAGGQLEVKLIVQATAFDNMWFAYDTTAYPTRLSLN